MPNRASEAGSSCRRTRRAASSAAPSVAYEPWNSSPVVTRSSETAVHGGVGPGQRLLDPLVEGAAVGRLAGLDEVADQQARREV